MAQLEEITLRRSNIVSMLVLAGVIASPALLYAQANPSGSADTTLNDRDDHGNWGWLGLLGLAGLMGLKRSDREKMHGQIR
jgi:hypothetical protein